MTCLACGLPTALAAIASPHPLGGLLCVPHLVLALSSDKPSLSSSGAAPVRAQPTVPRDRCWHEGITCPRPVAWEGINTRLCALHAPPLHRAPEHIARRADRTADDGMADAVLAVVLGLGATITHTRPGYYGTLDPLEGQ